jgi:hypothetical protein
MLSAPPRKGTWTHWMPPAACAIRSIVTSSVATPGRAVGDLARVGAGVGQQFLQRLPGRVGAHHDAEGVAHQPDHPGEVDQRVIGRARHQHGDAEDRVRHDRQRVAIRPRALRQRGRAHAAAGAGPVLDHHGLAEPAPGTLAQRPHLDVGGAARREGQEDADRPVREARLAKGGACQQRGGQRKRGAAGDALPGHGRFLPWSLPGQSIRAGRPPSPRGADGGPRRRTARRASSAA